MTTPFLPAPDVLITTFPSCREGIHRYEPQVVSACMCASPNAAKIHAKAAISPELNMRNQAIESIAKKISQIALFPSVPLGSGTQWGEPNV